MKPARRNGAVAGVDGCRGQWLVVRREPSHDSGDGRTTTADLVDDLAPLVDELRAGTLEALAIDMPIALLDVHPRACDVAARGLLGVRRSSVFPAPVRAALGCTDYDEARRRSRETAGIAPSVQAYNLLPSIRHLDELVRASDQDCLVEAHPELAFTRLNGQPLDEPKKTSAGRDLRRRLLVEADPTFSAVLDELVHPAAGRAKLPAIDLYDAAVLTITADHIVAGTERRLPDDDSGPFHVLDHLGRRAQIVW